MELVPKDELESSVQVTGNTFADNRAKKVDFYFYLGSRILYMTILLNWRSFEYPTISCFNRLLF